MSEAAAGATSTGRPLCRCHGRPTYWAKGTWECAAASNYRRTRNLRRKRIAEKRALLQQLEAELAQEDR